MLSMGAGHDGIWVEVIIEVEIEVVGLTPKPQLKGIYVGWKSSVFL